MFDLVSFRSSADPRSDGCDGSDGSVGFEAAVAFVNAVHRLVIAAAKATGDRPRPCYGQANRALARRYLDATGLAPSPAGGLVVDLRATLPGPTADPTLLPADGEPAPLVRRTNLRLLEAVGALTVAAERFESSGDATEFRAQVEAGVSAELCDAAVALLAVGGDAEVLLTPAPELPLGDAVRSTTAKLHERHRAAFDRAGAELRVDRRETEALLSGRVTDLGRRTPGDGAGTVTLEVVDPDPPARTVKVRVGPQRYDDAIGAHRAGRSIVVRGTLVRQGNSHWITAPLSFRVGPELAAPSGPDRPEEPLPLQM